MGGIEVNEAWLAVSAVAGLVVAIVAVWRIVVRATGSLRDEVKEEIRILRENDLRHLDEGIEGLDARMSRVEERMVGRLTESEERVTESLGQVHARLSRSEERMTESLLQLSERMAQSEERMMGRLTESEERMMGRLTESEERMMESLAQVHERLGRSEERMTESLAQVHERLTESEERMMGRLTQSEERMMARLSRSEERNATSFLEIRTDLKDTRTELLEAIRAVSVAPEAGALV